MTDPPRPARHVHIVGIGGSIMSAIARLLSAGGWRVSGSDQQDSEALRALAAEGIEVFVGHEARHLAADVTWVAHSSAVGAANPELAAARARGLRISKRDEVLGEIVNAGRGLAVAGTHGKTTTSGLAACLLTEAGLDPTFLVGSVLTNYATNCRAGRGDWIVVEADEYDRAFLTLHPQIAIVTNVESDHPDIYADFADYVATFRQFVAGLAPGGLLLLGADCPTAPSLAADAPVRVQTYGLAPGSDWRVSAVDQAGGAVSFDLTAPDRQTVRVATALAGRHNAVNAAGAIAAAVEAGVPLGRAAELAGRFVGTQRRFERLIDRGGILVVDDYAHHPTEVRATIAAARALGRRLRVVFEPHQFARTAALLEHYAGAFDEADETLLCDIYRARETDTHGVDSQRLADIAGGAGHQVFYVGTHDTAFERLTTTAGPSEVWLVMGAGDVTGLAHRLAQWVSAQR